MKFKKTIVLFLVLIAAAILIYFLPQTRFGPVAMVEYNMISYKALTDISNASKQYYENINRTYNIEDNLDTTTIDESEYQRATLSQLIDDNLIDKELQNRVGGDLSGLIEKRISDLDSDEDFKKAITGLSGLTYKDYKKLILIPQAKREILEGRLYLDNATLESWLENKRRGANVVIFSSKYSWTGDNVEISSQ